MSDGVVAEWDLVDRHGPLDRRRRREDATWASTSSCRSRAACSARMCDQAPAPPAITTVMSATSTLSRRVSECPPMLHCSARGTVQPTPRTLRTTSAPSSLIADPVDQILDGVALDFVAPPVDAVFEVFAGQDDPGPVAIRARMTANSRRDRATGLAVGEPGPMRGHVEADVAVAEDRVRVVAALAAQHGPDPGHQFTRAKGLTR